MITSNQMGSSLVRWALSSQERPLPFPRSVALWVGCRLIWWHLWRSGALSFPGRD